MNNSFVWTKSPAIKPVFTQKTIAHSISGHILPPFLLFVLVHFRKSVVPEFLVEKKFIGM
jgi:hypothetical protein